MPRDRPERDPRHFYDDYYYAEEPPRDREHRSHHHRRHRHREHHDESATARRERRERRRADEARRQAELDLDELRARRESYYSRAEPERRREPQRMAQEIRIEREKAKPRSTHKEVKRSGTKSRRRVENDDDDDDDDRSDDYVYGRPQSRGAVEEAPAKRSSPRRRSDEGGSSRTGHSPQSGSRSASVRRVIEVPKVSGNTSVRDPSRVYMSTRPALRRTSTLKLPTATAAPVRIRSVSVREVPYASPQRRSTGGLLANLFKPPVRVPTQTHKESARVDCLVCMNDDLPVHKTVKLGCGHRMCYSCLKRQFTLSVNDPQHMPPKCCNAEHIPLKYVERLFDDKFKKLWNKKYQEYTTGNRLYCPTKGCGEWIKPGKVRMDMTYGRKYARCRRCQTKVCVSCNSKFHTRRECPKDDETNRLVQMAKDQGWQRCYSCKALVELKEGCNHMTCRCTAQFCMVCALPWKTCNCPWFNYSHINDEDRLNDMRVPYIPREEIVEVVEMPLDHAPPQVRRSSTRIRQRDDRDMQRADEALAAHLQSQLRLSSAPIISEARRADPAAHVYGFGNSGTHHINESYTVRPLATSTARTTAHLPTSTRFFSRRLVPPQPAPAPVPVRAPHRSSAPAVSSSTMAGLSRDGTKRGANRVGTWLNHIELDTEAIATAPRFVEVDDWRVEGSMVGID